MLQEASSGHHYHQDLLWLLCPLVWGKYVNKCWQLKGAQISSFCGDKQESDFSWAEWQIGFGHIDTHEWDEREASRVNVKALEAKLTFFSRQISFPHTSDTDRGTSTCEEIQQITGKTHGTEDAGVVWPYLRLSRCSAWRTSTKLATDPSSLITTLWRTG